MVGSASMTVPLDGRTPLDVGLDHIASQERLWLRIGAVRGDDGQWTLRVGEIVSGGAPPSWVEQAWEYPSALFIARTAGGAAVRSWLQGGAITLPHFVIQLPALS